MGIRVARSRAASGLVAATALLLLLVTTAVCAVVLHAQQVPTLADPADGAERPLLVAQAAVYVAVVLTVLLAAVAVSLGVRLAAAVRERELWLVRARGYSGAQVQGLTIVEGLVAAAPAVLVGPLLADIVLVATDPERTGSALADVGPLMWAVSGGVGALGVGALALVLHRASKRGEQVEAKGRSAVLRTGLDVLVGLAAALGVWQLVRYGGPVTTGADGGLAVDPLIVAAPTLVLLVGGLVALRLLMWLARRFDGGAARTRGAGGPLGVWQVARRPGRQVGPALLMVLALGVGALATTYSASWQASQTAQATLSSGADLRIETGPGGQSPLSPAGLAAVPGTDGVMPVVVGSGSGGAGTLRMLAWDAEAAPAVTGLPDDLVSGEGLAAASRTMVEARPDGGLLPLPDGTTGLRLAATLAHDSAGLAAPDTGVGLEDLAVRAVVRDSAGVLHRTHRAAFGAAVDGVADATVPLARPLPGQTAGGLAGATVVAIEVGIDLAPPGSTLADPVPAAHDVARVDLLLTVDAETLDGTIPLDAPSAWRATSPSARQHGGLRLRALDAPGATHGASLHLVATATTSDAHAVTLRPAEAGTPAAGTLTTPPPLVTLPALSFFGTEPATVTVAGQRVELTPVGQLVALPGQELDAPRRAGFVADLPSLALAVFEGNGRLLDVSAWWFSVPDDDARTLATEALATDPHGPVTLDRQALTGTLLHDPLGTAVVTALRLALAAAVVLAVTGVGLAAVIAARERRAELAVLRALGTSPRQLQASVAVEHLLLLGTATVLGGALGVGLAWLLLPRLVRDVFGEAPVLPVATVVPWGPLLAVTAVVAGAVALCVVLVTRRLTRTHLATTLRAAGPR